MGKKKAGVILIFMLVAAAAAGGIWYFLENGGRDSNDRVYVQKVSVIMGGATGAQNRYSGVVQPQKTVEIKADAERTIGEVYVKVGDAVEEGTPLFSYDVEDINIELQQEKLELDNQDIEISNYKSQISELEKERQKAAEANKFEYTTQIQTIQTQIKKAECEKSSKQLEVDKLQKRIDNSEVLSTASGIVKSINSEDNQEPDASTAYMTILSTGEYRIQGMVNEQNIGMISSGAEVIIRSRVDEEVTWRGMIDTIDTGEAASSESSDNDYYESESDDGMTSSSKYPFYVTLESAEGLMLGQHVLIELDEGQTEEKEGIWLFSSYIVREGQEQESGMPELSEDWADSTEFPPSPEALYPTETTEWPDGTEQPAEQAPAYVWADDGNGRLEKRTVELGEYDAALDEYEILSGLSEDDLIAWPMEGLYEGVRTVTDMDEVDYNSGLYNQGTEEIWDDSEMDLLPEEDFSTENYDLPEDEYPSDYEDGMEEAPSADPSILDSLMPKEDENVDRPLMDMGVPR